MTLEEDKILRLMLREKAVIDLTNPGDIYPAFPRGDRRKRPVFWIEKHMLDRLVTLGGIEVCDGNACITERMKTRLTGGTHAGAHRDMEEREIYTPAGSLRSARVNHRTSALRSLARKCTAAGEPFLSKARVEAGEQFARDYDGGGMGFVATQAYDRAGVDSTFRADGQEMAIISRMDRRKRVSEAIACLGPGLDRAAIAVCCENFSTEQLEKTENWTRHSGRTVLILALDRLVAFYGTLPGMSSDAA